MTTEEIIEKIDNYLEEPHSLSASWVKALQICRRALIQNDKLTYEVDRLKASAEYAYNRGKDEGKKELADKLKQCPVFEYHSEHIDNVLKEE